MKKLSVIALLFSLGLFSIGCEPADDTAAPADGAAPADSAAPAETPAPAEGA